MTNAFITGITGFVGSHLLDFLIDNTDWRIHGFLRWQDNLENIRQHIPRINAKDRITLHYGDLNDAFSVQKAIEKAAPDYIFHLAAQSYPQTSFESPAETLGTNIIGTCNTLECARGLGSKPIILVCSSSEVFGRVPKEKTPIKEDCSFHPASPYAISKVGTDLLGQHYAEAYGMNVQITRMFTHTGPRRGDVFAESSFAKQIAMIEAGLQEPVIKVGNLNSMRTWADVRDAVRAYYMAVTINPIPGSVYNIGGEYSCMVGDMLRTLVTASNLKVFVDIQQDAARMRPIDADLQLPDCSKFKAHTGWKPEIPFEQTMRDLLQYWRDRVSKEGAFLNR
jgi:GDPmannose 4,6-dehydratase